ncbi:MAG: hypothetical protein PUK21_00250 [Peptostreptococcaceae bacterium]|nr:hypothetical protein [Peptostreptococcaceae bacterium]MDY5739515.1 hypothetical protein [Anaerovoracaceae bacterium]
MKKKLILLICCIFSIGVVAGCGSGSGSSSYTEAPEDYKSELSYNENKIAEVEKEYEKRYSKEYKVLKDEYDLDVENMTKIGLKFRDAVAALEMSDLQGEFLESDNIFRKPNKGSLKESIFFGLDRTHMDTYGYDGKGDYEYYFVPTLNLKADKGGSFGKSLSYRSGISAAGNFGDFNDIKKLKGQTQEGVLDDMELGHQDYKNNVYVLKPFWLIHTGMHDGEQFYENVMDDKKKAKLTVEDVEEISLDLHNAKDVGALRTKLKIEVDGFKPYIQDSIMIFPKHDMDVLNKNSKYGLNFTTYGIVYEEGTKDEKLDKVYKLRELCIAHTFKMKDDKMEHRKAFDTIYEMRTEMGKIPSESY